MLGKSVRGYFVVVKDSPSFVVAEKVRASPTRVTQKATIAVIVDMTSRLLRPAASVLDTG
jgi:hypothetical protein